MPHFTVSIPSARAIAAPADRRRASWFALGLLVPVALLLALGPRAARADDANVALRKPVSASGTYGIYGPGRGNDDHPTTIWNGGAHEACWKVDLQGVHAIRSIVVSSNQFGASGLQTVFQVSASLDGSNWKPVGAPTTGRGDQTFTFATPGTEMRHIRYCTLSGSTNWATLGELKAYGTPVGAAPPSHGGGAGDGGSGATAAAGAASVKALVTRDACTPQFGSINVPVGMVATGFVVRELAAGLNCYNHLPIQEKGWGIAGNNGGQLGSDVYWYFRTATDVETRSAPLSSLVLLPGPYLVYVKGGKGAFVTLDYVLRAAGGGGGGVTGGGGNRGGAVDNSDCEKRTPFGDCIISNVKTVPTNR